MPEGSETPKNLSNLQFILNFIIFLCYVRNQYLEKYRISADFEDFKISRSLYEISTEFWTPWT